MPNWFSDRMKVVEGDPQEIWDGIRGERLEEVWWTIFGEDPPAIGRVPFDFNRLIPAPEGAVWPTWHNGNWGAKYADYFTFVDKATLTFDTPWDPPVQIYEAIARKFPNHKIEITGSDCEYLGRHLHVVIANGELSGEITDCDCPDVGSFRDQAWRQMGRPSVYDEEALIRLAEQIRQEIRLKRNFMPPGRNMSIDSQHPLTVKADVQAWLMERHRIRELSRIS